MGLSAGARRPGAAEEGACIRTASRLALLNSVYFCCLEAIQNTVKHAGPDAEANIRVWHIGDTLAFDVRDSGVGFDPRESPPGTGLLNMHDRIEAIGGKLWVAAQPGRGTWVRGRVPLR